MDLVTLEGRQHLLDRLLKKQIYVLKKKCFYHKQRPFLWENVEIIESTELDDTTAGRWHKIKETKKGYTHLIEINSRLINDYSQNLTRLGISKKSRLRRITNVIIHELAHAFIYERFEELALPELDYIHADGSPIFLAFLQFVGQISGHHCGFSYLYSKVHKEVLKIREYDKLEDYLISLYFGYVGSIRQIKADGERITNNTIISPRFRFSTRSSGLKLNKELSSANIFRFRKDNTIDTAYSYSTYFSIGSCVHPSDFKEMYYKKVNATKNFEKIYMLNKEKTYVVKDYNL